MIYLVKKLWERLIATLRSQDPNHYCYYEILYLGVPNPHSRVMLFSFQVDRVWKFIIGWKVDAFLISSGQGLKVSNWLESQH